MFTRAYVEIGLKLREYDGKQLRRSKTEAVLTYKTMAKRLERVLTNDPGTGVTRHVDAGYGEAIEFAKCRPDIKIPMQGVPRELR